MNISSVIIRVSPGHLETLLEHLRSTGICEVHLHDEKGRIIVTIEGAGADEEVARLKKIQAMPHVVSADMVYAYSEEELEREKEKMEKKNEIPEWLNDDKVKAEDIRYKGDLRGNI